MRSDLVLLLAVGCSYSAPIDPDEPPPGSIVSGQLITDDPEPADVVVLVYAAEQPPPPEGTGSPLTFATVPGEAFGVGSDGLRSAPFDVTGLPEGDYLLSGLMDRDGDFNPFVPVTAGATCGDRLGAHLATLTDRTPAAVHLEPDTRVTGVSIVIGDPLPTERPAFAIEPEATVDRAASLDPSTPQTFTLQATGVYTTVASGFPLVLDGPCPTVDGGPTCLPVACDVTLWTHVTDADADGVPDLRPDYPVEAGLPDVWPRVYLELLGAPEGERWAAEAIPLLAELGAMRLGAPAPLPFGTDVPRADLSVTWLPVARHEHQDGALTDDTSGTPYDLVDLRTTGDPTAIPAGSWSVTVVSRTGQTWQVPNVLAAIGDTTRPQDFDPTRQLASLSVE